MQRQAQRRSSAHERIAHCQLVYVLRKQRPLPDVQDGASLFEVAQGGRECHDGQADPEEDEEAGEVGILARGVEVGDARLVFDGREDATAVLLAELFAYGRGGLDGGRRILWRGGCAASTRREVSEEGSWREDRRFYSCCLPCES